MIATLLLFAAVTGDHSMIRVDVAELNHVMRWCDDKGEWEETLCQWILWDWSITHGRYVVADWVLVKYPARVTRAGGRVVISLRTRNGSRAVIVAPSVVQETWTTCDPELENRDVLPSDRRRGMLSR